MVNLLLLSMITPVFAVQFSDIRGHWAATQINNWVSKGLVKGYDNGTFLPNKQIKRAEFIALVNRAFGFIKLSSLEFSDVTSEEWYSQDILKAEAQGYISGYDDGTVRPEEPITRQEVAVILGRILKLKEQQTYAYKYTDNRFMADWGIGYIGAISNLGLISGFPDKTFKPDDNATRAEVIAILYKAVGVLYNAAGSYGPDSGFTNISGNVTVSKPDINLKRMTINGNLYLTEGIGTGAVSLENVTVYGTTIISGGGLNSIRLLSSALGKVVIKSPDSTEVRVSAEGSTSVLSVDVQTSARLEENNLLGQGFNDVTVNVPAWNSLQLSGDFSKVDVNSLQALVNVFSGSITQLNVTSYAKGAQVNIYPNAAIKTMNLNEAAIVYGTGTIDTANINVTGSTIAKKPTNVHLATGVTSTIAGISTNTTVFISSLSDQNITVGTSLDLTLYFNPDNATKNVSSNNTTVASTKLSGSTLTITGRSVGTAKITVSGNYTGYSSTSQAFKVNVTDVTGVLYSAAETTAGSLGTLQVNKITVPNNARLGSYEVKKLTVESGANAGANEVNKMTINNSVSTSGTVAVTIGDERFTQIVNIPVSGGDSKVNVANSICNAINLDQTINQKYIASLESGSTVVLTNLLKEADRNVVFNISNDGNTGIGAPSFPSGTSGRTPGDGNISFSVTNNSTTPAVNVTYTLAVAAGDSPAIVINKIINNSNFTAVRNTFSQYNINIENGNTIVFTSNNKQKDKNITLNITDLNNTGVSSTSPQGIIGYDPGTGSITFQVSDGTINQIVTAAISDGDSSSTIAQKVLAAANANSAIYNAYTLSIENGNTIVLSSRSSQTSKTVNLAISDTGLTGVGSVSTSTPNTAGVAAVQEVNILTITHAAVKTGVLNCYFTDGNVSDRELVYIYAGDSIQTIAYAIYRAFYGEISGYTVTYPTSDIIRFTNNVGETDRNVVITIK